MNLYKDERLELVKKAVSAHFVELNAKTLNTIHDALWFYFSSMTEGQLNNVIDKLKEKE